MYKLSRSLIKKVKKRKLKRGRGRGRDRYEDEDENSYSRSRSGKREDDGILNKKIEKVPRQKPGKKNEKWDNLIRKGIRVIDDSNGEKKGEEEQPSDQPQETVDLTSQDEIKNEEKNAPEEPIEHESDEGRENDDDILEL